MTKSEAENRHKVEQVVKLKAKEQTLVWTVIWVLASLVMLLAAAEPGPAPVLPPVIAERLQSNSPSMGKEPATAEVLDLYGSKVCDEDLAALKLLPQLKLLYLGPQVTDAGLEHVKCLKKLMMLGLNNTKISDAGLEHLRSLTQLTALHLRDTKISDTGLDHLKLLTRLTDLDLCKTQVTDAGLVHLKWLTRLHLLSLSGTQISDAGLAHLKPLTQLWELCIGGTKVSDAGLEHLRPLTQLVDIELRETQVTKAGVEALRKQIPERRIRW